MYHSLMLCPTDNAQIASKNLAMLIETQSAEVLTTALDALNRELDDYEYKENLLGGKADGVSSLYEAATGLHRHHQDSIVQLQGLTANLGLLHMPLSSHVLDKDKEFVKQLVLLHAVKTTLWGRLQRMQDELNPFVTRLQDLATVIHW
jgi:fumarate reductase subunit D